VVSSIPRVYVYETAHVNSCETAVCRTVYGARMASTDEDKRALGARLAAARKLAGMTMEQAAARLTALGYPISKQGVGHWETGRSVPDAFWLRRLAKLYGTTLDALVWDDAISMEAMQLAAQYDGLSDAKQKQLRALWMAYIETAADDATVEDRMPATRKVTST